MRRAVARRKRETQEIRLALRSAVPDRRPFTASKRRDAFVPGSDAVEVALATAPTPGAPTPGFQAIPTKISSRSVSRRSASCSKANQIDG